jgi:hypothetical protein
MTTDLYVRVMFLLKSVLGAHLNLTMINKSNRSDKNDMIKYFISIYD